MVDCIKQDCISVMCENFTTCARANPESSLFSTLCVY